MAVILWLDMLIRALQMSQGEQHHLLRLRMDGIQVGDIYL